MDELELDLEEGQNINKTEQRIKNLSSKVAETATERDEALTKAQAAEEARVALEKERDFYASFSTNASKYPAASEHMDAIKEKVLSGYSVEDATVSVLNAEGKLAPATAGVQPIAGPAAGGSAATQLTGDTRSYSEMSREDKRSALFEAEKSGELARLLANQ